MIFEYRLINMLVFLHSTISFVYCSFHSNLFSQITKYCSLKNMFDLSKDIQFFFLNVFKIRRVIIFSLSYRYIVIFCVLLLYVKVIKPLLKVSDSLCMKVLAAALFDLCLCLLVVFFLQLPGALKPKPKKTEKGPP